MATLAESFLADLEELSEEEDLEQDDVMETEEKVCRCKTTISANII